MGVGDQSQELEATRVDLGDDLLEKTAVLTVPDSRPAQGTSSSSKALVQVTDSQDAFESARILLSEGFLEDAKQLLRKILIADSTHFLAREKLSEIHELELRQILEGRERVVPRMQTSAEVAPLFDPGQFDSDLIARELELDLGLETVSRLELLARAEAEAQYGVEILRRLRGADARAWIDVGIAYLEMGLCGIAERVFHQAGLEDPQLLPEASLLRAQASFSSGRFSDAEMILDELLARSTDSDRIVLRAECGYWMGRVLERKGQHEEAKRWYREVHQIDATHRDVQDRLRRNNS